MNITTFSLLYIYAIPVFILCDILWIGFIAKNFYHDKIGFLLGPVNWVAAGIFYILFISGLTFFATYPGIQAQSIKLAIMYGGLFGFFTYLTYDLTNLATIKNWPVSVAVVDILWGTVLCAVVAGVASGVFFYFHA